MAAICHCNDCRRSNAQAISFAVVNVLEWAEFSFNSPTLGAKEVGKIAATAETRDEADAAHCSEWVPATAFLDNSTGPREDVLKDTWLRIYVSSPGRSRGFCGRCGTQIWYFVFGSRDALPEWWFPQLDLWAGAVDRCDLEKEWFVPDRELWMDFGLEWAGVITGQGHAEGMERGRYGTFK